MRYLRKWQLAVVCLLALALIAFAPAPRGTAQAPGYTVTDLGTLGSGAGAQSRAFGLDECGRVVGESQAVAGASAPFRPFRWSNGVLSDLGTLGGSSGTAYAINQSGTVTGSALTSGSLLHPFVRYEAAPMFDLGTLPGGFTAEGYDINASGQVVGVTEEGASQQDRAFIWNDANGNHANDANEMQALTALWGTPIRAFGINDAGQVAGTANLPSAGTHAFVTVGGVALDIGTLGGAISVATEVNDSGEVVGYSYIFSSDITQSFHAFLWKDANHNGQSDSGEMLDLGVLSGDRNSYAYDINNGGLVVGASETGTSGNNVSRAFIWSSANGMQDLNVVAPGTGWTFREARGINNRGQIVGTGLNPDGKVHAFLLTPTNVGPSPCDATPTPTPVPGTLAFSAATYTVGEGGGSAVISVSRTGGSDGAVSVNYTTSAGGTATAGPTADYIATNGTLNFANGEVSKTFAVTINEDTLDEADETVNLTLSSPGGGATLGAQTTAVLTITDNDAAPTVSVSDASVTEGNAGTTNATFNVTLSAASGKTVTVNYLTGDNTAVAPGDYTAVASTTLTFNPGETSKPFNVAVVGDTTDELNEIFFVGLTGPTNATLSDGQGEGTIVDDDGPPSLSINDISVAEGNGGPTTATFTVSLLPASGQSVSVNYATADGTATTADSDYAAKSGSVSFGVGETSKTITVTVNGDIKFESNETFNVNLSGATNATVTDAQGVGTITNDDSQPVLFIGDITGDEGSIIGTTIFTINVSLSNPSSLPASVNYATADGTATIADNDYVAKSGTLNFAPGEFVKSFDVIVNIDSTWEPDETFFINLSGASGATIDPAHATATATIRNDEPPSTFRFDAANYSVTEGGQVSIGILRTPGTAGGVSVHYATSNGSATSGADYESNSGTVTFGGGETLKVITINTTHDTLDEPNETVAITLSSPVGGSLGTPNPATLTINDNDPQPTFQFNSATYSVGEAGDLSTGLATITVTRTGGTNGGVSVNYATASGGTATVGSDYTATSGTLNFAQDETSKTFTVAISEDALDESNETINLSLTGSSVATDLGAQSTAVLTINDNDPPPSLSVNDVNNISEGGTATFTVTLSAVSAQTVRIAYATADGTAVAGSDYTSTTNLLTFSPGETSKTINVTTLGDSLDETNETFFVNLSAPDNATIADAQGVGTITDDDAPPSLSINDVTTVELGGVAQFTVTLSAPSGQTVTVKYATADGTADTSTDYVSTSGTLTFSPGQTTQNINVQLGADNFDEPDDETFFVNLSDATNATIADAQGVGTIHDNDATPALFINDITVTEGNSGTTNATFTVSLGPGSGQTVTVNYTTANITAAAGSDYTAVSGTLTFAPLESTKTITVQIAGDTDNEPNESFYVILSNPSHAFILDTHGECFITNDDAPTVRFSQATYPAVEGAHFVTVTVTRTGDTLMPFGVDFATSDGTATERRDYTAVSGHLQFASGETSKTFDVLLTEDSYQESEETINLTLSNPTSVVVLGTQPTATVVIAANDNPPPNFNPIDISSDFVRQHYHDFLNREPDASGLAFWTGEIEQCGSNAQCREVKRINVSAAFFLSIEFQETGYLVYRTYKAAYGDATSPNVAGTVPVVRLNEFLPDTRRIGEDVVVNVGDWQAKLNANKDAYMGEFVQRQRFLTAYPLTLTAAQFVDKLNQNAGGVLTTAERDALVNDLSTGAKTRAQVLRAVSENPSLQQNEFRRAFVLMQFYGYLRRNPDDPQDTDFRGWKFWLDKLNDHNGNYVEAEMVKAFLDSIEYRTRFAP